jgi:multiple sugar transport system permease protein
MDTTVTMKKENRPARGRGLFRLTPRTREAITFYIVVLPWIIGFLVFTFGPMGYSVYLSMAKWDIIGTPRWVGLDNYKQLFFKDDLFWTSLKVTAIYSFAGVPLRLALSLILALLLNQAVMFRNFFRTLFYTPSVMSGVAVSLLWMWVFNPEFGVVNHVLAQFGIQGPRWIYDEHWALPSLIIMSLWGAGSEMIIFLAGLQSVPQALYDAAEVDGAGVWHRFRNVTFPMITPVVLFNLVMGIIGSFQVFTQSYVMTGGGPHYATHFLVLYIYNSAFEYLKMGYAAALAWVLFVVILGLTLFVFRSTPFWVFYEAQVEERRAK